MAEPPFKLFFTGRDDPRDGCIMIGEDTKPVFFRFETPGSAQTTVRRGTGEVVAVFDWVVNGHPGLATIIGVRQIPMLELVMNGTVANSRMFEAVDGRNYEWRRANNDSGSYNLFAIPSSMQVAAFHRYLQDTPIGPSHAYMQYTFDDEALLLDALLALSLNRWIDLQRR